MSQSMSIIKQSLTIIIASLLLVSGVFAQANSEETERDRRDKQQTKKSQAVSKSVYEKITRAQEAMEAEDNDTALKILNTLRASSKLSEYERQNVMNYLGFVYYNMEDIPRAMKAYEEMLRIPSIEEQIKKNNNLYSFTTPYNGGKLFKSYFVNRRVFYFRGKSTGPCIYTICSKSLSNRKI